MPDPHQRVDGGTPLTEHRIVGELLAGLGVFGPDIQTAVEVCSHGRARTDVLLLRRGELIGIEVKRTDWRRAVAQAVLNRYCVDRSYIALWGSSVTSRIVEEANQRGVGVIAVGEGSVRVLRRAPKANPDPVIRERMRVLALRSVSE